MESPNRRIAKGEIAAARYHLLIARKLIDGLGEVSEHNGTMAIVATDDFMDAVVTSEKLDEEITAMEENA